MASSWLDDAVRAFGAACKDKLAGPGDREAAIRAPLEGLLGAAGAALGLRAVFHDEVRDTERQVRPDYGVSVAGAMAGYVEVKAPGREIDPARLRGHDKVQWERQRDLPNLLYTNGTQWRLYRDGELHGTPVTLVGDLPTSGNALGATPELELLLTDFLRWKPAPITSVGALVRAVAPLTRLLRGEVLDQLAEEKAALAAGAEAAGQPFSDLALDWRRLLFPDADDKTFADGYAQTVTFALLLARTEGISLEGRGLHEVGSELGADHSLMGRALQVLTDDVAKDFKVTLALLVRVIGAVEWPRIRKGRRDTYLHLYERFLEEYDPALRQASGSYYTPREVVEQMVRLTEEALIAHLGKVTGFLDPSVVVVDPAMGTGTYLHTVIDRCIQTIEATDGAGAVPGTIPEVARRLYGFEIQTGPYAVAELRAADLLAAHGASAKAITNLYVTDTLDDPGAQQPSLGSHLAPIAASRKQANKVKADTQVTVVIGNPPYRERAQGRGGWVENGRPTGLKGKKAYTRPILEDFREPGNGLNEYVLKNLYVYFWRWATWKVFESTPADDAGVVCFITTSGYLRGPGFKGMRRYLRTWASRGWVIDLTPEGQTPDVPTRIFPGVRQPLAIAMFVREPGTSDTDPASISFRAVTGRQKEKFAQLADIRLDDDAWRATRSAWTAPLTPEADGDWDTYPALADLFPWVSPGIKPNRTWVYSPDPDTLRRRWNRLTSESDPSVKESLLKQSRDSGLHQQNRPLSVGDSHEPAEHLASANGDCAEPWPVGYRALDRQWIIPDSRLIDQPRPALWDAWQPGQVYLNELHSSPISSGPGLTLSAFIPDMHAFKGSEGGRVLPMLHPDGSANLAPGLLEAWSQALGTPVTARDVPAYVAAVVAHPGFTATFADELTTPGIRVPLTTDPDLLHQAVELGQQVVWAWTYGASCTGPGRPAGDIRYAAGDPRRVSCTQDTDPGALPEAANYDATTETLSLAGKTFAPVTPAVWGYDVGGVNIIKSWVNYRKATPGGKKSSPLDDVTPGSWPQDWTRDLIDLLTVLDRITRLHDAQAVLLESILAGGCLRSEKLASGGVVWPTTKEDRKPHGRLKTAEGQFDLE